MIIRNPIGKKGEDAAVEYLKKKGYKILDRNFQGRQGEIDIIAIDPGTNSSNLNSQSHGLSLSKGLGKTKQALVFVEVKTRSSFQFGTPLESIRHAKISSILITAGFYTATHRNLPEQQRVDAIAVIIGPGGEVKNIEHIENISGF